MHIYTSIPPTPTHPPPPPSQRPPFCEDVILSDVVYLTFIHMPGDGDHKQFRSLLSWPLLGVWHQLCAVNSLHFLPNCTLDFVIGVYSNCKLTISCWSDFYVELMGISFFFCQQKNLLSVWSSLRKNCSSKIWWRAAIKLKDFFSLMDFLASGSLLPPLQSMYILGNTNSCVINISAVYNYMYTTFFMTSYLVFFIRHFCVSLLLSFCVVLGQAGPGWCHSSQPLVQFPWWAVEAYNCTAGTSWRTAVLRMQPWPFKRQCPLVDTLWVCVGELAEWTHEIWLLIFAVVMLVWY